MFDTLKLMVAIVKECFTHPRPNSLIELVDGKAVVTRRSKEPITLRADKS
jgi:hypothetical protein